MSNGEVKTLVEKERAALLEDNDTIEEAVVLRTGRADTVAQGLLVLERTAEAIEWFSGLHEEWCIFGEEVWETKFENKAREKAQMRPWHEYHMCLLTGLLGQTDLEEDARTVYERATEPFVDDLDQRGIEHRIDTAGLLAGFLLDEPGYESFGQSLREYVDQNGDEYDRARYPPYADIVDGLAAGETATVTDGITSLVDFHEAFVIGAPDVNAVDEAFALDACAMLVLARREGMDIEVDSEYVPAALSDAEYYPVQT